jgi:hypothetical protein
MTLIAHLSTAIWQFGEHSSATRSVTSAMVRVTLKKCSSRCLRMEWRNGERAARAGTSQDETRVAHHISRNIRHVTRSSSMNSW